MQAKKQDGRQKPVFIVKSTRMGGLDYLHISLIALVLILIGFAFALAYFKPGSTLVNCPYGVLNGTCAGAPYNSSQATQAVGRILAGYAASNTSLSVLAYYSLPNRTTVSYVPDLKEWVAVVPYRDPFYNNETLNVSFILSGNLTLRQPFLSMVGPAKPTNDTVVSFGTVSLAGKSQCSSSQPVPVYFITDPYVPGFINYTEGALGLQRQYGGSVNVSYYFVSSSYSASKYGQYGVAGTQALAGYLSCASKQGRLGSFVSNLSLSYTGEPLPYSTLSDVALGSGLNATRLSACMDNVSSALAVQTALAAFYSVQSVPVYIANCRYQSIPGTAQYAVDYALDQAKR